MRRMDGIVPWKNWTMETLIPEPSSLPPMVGTAKNRFGSCVLETDVQVSVDQSLFSRISSLSRNFAIDDIELKNSGRLFTDSPSDLKRNRRDSGGTNPEFFYDSILPNDDVSSRTPLPPFHHFRLPPPPPPSSMITRAESRLAFGVETFSTTCSDVVVSQSFHSDVDYAGTKPLLSPSPPASSSGEVEEKILTKLHNCRSAPSTIPPFKGKPKNSRLFSQDRRRATLHNPAVPESWISPESALLTVLTRDLYPPPSEFVAPPPKQADLEKYYAAFLPKNLSDDYAEGVAQIKASSIPSLLGRSASTESLHKDRLLPLMDDFLDCGDLEFSTRQMFQHAESSVEDSFDNSSRQSFSAEVNSVGFYLASGTPPRSPVSRDDMSDSRWAPYFGDPKEAQGQFPPSIFPFLGSSSLESPGSSSSYGHRKKSSSSPRRTDQTHKRSRSAEPTKTDLRSEKAKKFLRVRFADSEGKDLAKSKAFRTTDDLNIPTRVLEPLRSGIERGLPAIGVRHFHAKNFIQNPRLDVEKLVKERKVVLKEIYIAPDLVIGSVVVGNVSSEHKKNVFIRCTYNDWNSFIDVTAGYLSCDATTSMSTFSFSLGIPRDFVKGDMLEFAVGYTGMGRIYWDNNEGNNYIVECFARQCPLHSEDRSWISFI